ncbi:DUF262 domain-containing protein [Chryseobacterium sp. GMJ5]|uniref:DUF262 domain-containing protein n=1 Tax=Chryseobacterium gilvum TaxID=2976534 RepID=A0ABT2VTL8_9FLAO|nr:DUF262 domain-containing protein [Chryseobacterium gilvum]MCU7613336.1 DUF262 domain-containing protein [Chryseobacterium gilvum]
MPLQEEIDVKAKEIHTENLSMSIGEIISMYNDGDLDIHPEFQRFYRWSATQKSKLIESILLNIPIPSIFVAQRPDGIWDVVDGLQRLSTIFEFIGILKNDKNILLPALTLVETQLLPSLKDKQWENIGEIQNIEEMFFTEAQQRYFKRSRLNFVIIQKESDSTSKYELFQRLNTGGSSLTPQEVRNCLLIMNNEKYFGRLKELAEFPSFLETVNLSEKNLDEQYEKELVSRFLVIKNASQNEFSSISELSTYLDNKLVEFFENNDNNWEDIKDNFERTFNLINEQIGENAFKRYSIQKQVFNGSFIVSAYEMIAINIAKNIEYWEQNRNQVKTKIIECWEKIDNESISWRGYNAAGRLPKTISVGEEIFL